MKTKHTPGPWASLYQQNDEGLSAHFIFRDDNTYLTAHARTFINPNITKDESEANAHLIAAAPELLEALNKIDEIAFPETDDYDPGDILSRIQSICSKAIAKATGGQ